MRIAVCEGSEISFYELDAKDNWAQWKTGRNAKKTHTHTYKSKTNTIVEKMWKVYVSVGCTPEEALARLGRKGTR